MELYKSVTFALVCAATAVQAGEPSDQATNRPGNSHICFLVDDFMSCYEDLKSQGVKFKSDPVHITAGPNQGGLVVYFLDPDGHPLEMFQPAADPADDERYFGTDPLGSNGGGYGDMRAAKPLTE